MIFRAASNVDFTPCHRSIFECSSPLLAAPLTGYWRYRRERKPFGYFICERNLDSKKVNALQRRFGGDIIETGSRPSRKLNWSHVLDKPRVRNSIETSSDERSSCPKSRSKGNCLGQSGVQNEIPLTVQSRKGVVYVIPD